ncbi:MAG: DUF4114 domain-containing protein [Phormidesmis sp.]
MENVTLFTESNDAGESLATATSIITEQMMPLESISGNLSGDADLYKIFLAGGQTFAATTISRKTMDIPVDQALGLPIAVVIDPKIFLFDEQGNGVYANDDLFGSAQSTLPSGAGGFSPEASGIYYLGISGTGYDAVSADGQIFPGAPFDQVVGPTGLGGGSPLTGFAGDTSESSGEYTISLTGAQTIMAVFEPGDGDFTPNEARDKLTLTSLNGASAVRFSLDQVAVGNASAIEIFKVNGNGVLTKVDEFSLLQSGKLAAGFAPTFSLNVDQGDTLQFRLIENGKERTATISALGNGGAKLDFGGGTKLSLKADLAMNAPNLVAAGVLQGNDGQRDDGAAIDFSTQAGTTSEVKFTLYREAAYDSTVGLYVIDDLTGTVTVNGNTFMVGDEGYEAAALQRSIDVTLQAENGGVSTFTATVDNLLYGTFISVENSNLNSTETYFSYLGANSGDDHVKLLGNNALGFEDLPSLGDADYNDLVVTFEVV